MSMPMALTMQSGPFHRPSSDLIASMTATPKVPPTKFEIQTDSLPSSSPTCQVPEFLSVLKNYSRALHANAGGVCEL
jgi:hypothetical protein